MSAAARSLAARIKFCGLTRAEDARAAVGAGATYLGVIFAGGPRKLTPERASEVLADAPAGVKRVGVFATDDADAIGAIVQRVPLDVVQLHGGADAATLRRLRERLDVALWSVLRLEGSTLPAHTADLFEAADAVVLDAAVPGQLGGTGRALPWAQLVEDIAAVRGAGTLVLAGGLRPENVAEAVRLLTPQIVDVSSGVESAPGIKDPARLRAFADAVRSTETRR